MQSYRSPVAPANPADVVSIDAIIAAAYDVISGPAEQERDWDRERSLFWPGARLIPITKQAGKLNVEGSIDADALDIEGFIERSREYLLKSGFFEKEIARRTEVFGRIAHVWSTYESRHNEDDVNPFVRGINSIQLFDDGNRWWIVTIYWQNETPSDQIPDKYFSST